MRKLVKIVVCMAFVGGILWATMPSKNQNANYTGPGPMSITAGDVVAVFETPEPQGVVYKA